ncbi:MAG: plasmid stabilization protein [Oceanicaulis sp.]
MSAITIRKLPDHVHDALRRMAAERGMSVEALAREALVDFVRNKAGKGDLFADAEAAKQRLGVKDADWPEWTDEFDDPAFGRSVLGAEDGEKKAPGR